MWIPLDFVNVARVCRVASYAAFGGSFLSALSYGTGYYASEGALVADGVAVFSFCGGLCEGGAGTR